MESKMLMEMYDIVDPLELLLNQLIVDGINCIEEDCIDRVNIPDEIYRYKV